MTADDAPAITDLLNLMDIAAGLDEGWTVGEVRALMAGWLSGDPDDGRVLCAADGSLAALGMVLAPENGTRTDLFGGVHPDWRGRGIGRELMGWQFERIATLRDSTAPGQTWQVDSGAVVDDTPALHLFERFGMKPIRYFSEMHVSIPDATVAEDPSGVRIAPYTPDLYPTLYATHMEAFADHWGFQHSSPEKWAARTVESEVFRGDLSRMAFDGDEMVAYVLAHDGVDDSIHISHVGTRRPWRGRHIASALISQVLAAAAKDGKTEATLGVDAESPTGAVGVYERAGFAVKSRFVDYRREI